MAAGLKLALLSATLCAALGCSRADAQITGLAGIASASGPERAQRLIEGAKKEGTLTVYSSAIVEDLAAVAYAFEKKYAVTVKYWRASSEDILRRAMTEARGSRFETDVAETAAPEMEALQR